MVFKMYYLIFDFRMDARILIYSFCIMNEYKNRKNTELLNTMQKHIAAGFENTVGNGI